MKKLLLTLFILLFAVSAFAAQNYNPSGGKVRATKSTKNYECNLETLKEDTFKYSENLQFGDIIKIHTECIKKYPNVEYLYNNRGNAYKNIGKFNKALEDYNKALELNPNYISPYHGIMLTYFTQGDIDRALLTSDKIIALNKKQPSVYYHRGLIFGLKDNEEKALENYSLSIKYGSKTMMPAYIERASIYANRGENKLAIKDYKSYIKIYENFYKKKQNPVINMSSFDEICDVYRNMGVLYGRMGIKKPTLENLIISMDCYKAMKKTQKYNETKELIQKTFPNINNRILE